MAINDIKKKIKNAKQRRYLARDFDGFRAKLLQYARLYFPDQIQDFSEAGLGGLLLDMASFVGDNLSFYLDHQFNELNWATAIESKNIQKHLRSAGVKIRGAAPATSEVEFLFRIPAEVIRGGEYVPKRTALPVVGAGTVLASRNGTTFYLLEDLDFTKKDVTGNYVYKSTLVSTDSTGRPTEFVISRTGLCISGTEKTHTFRIPDVYQPFRVVTLPDEAVSDILEVKDSDGNVYYEVDSLSQDTVFRKVLRVKSSIDTTDFNVEMIPAPYRYTMSYDFDTRLTKLTFGTGKAETLDDELIPDPSSLALPLYGKSSFSKFSIDPNSMLKTRTLGIAPQNVTITINYRFGGGIDHNVSEGTIRTIKTLNLTFKSRPDIADVNLMRETADVINHEPAGGGDRAPFLNELRSEIPGARASQNRIVTKQDLIGRIFSLPNAFGRVFRASIRRDDTNNLASSVYICSRDEDGALAKSPDALKMNLRTYLNEFRMVSDALNILDVKIINFAIKFECVAAPGQNKSEVAQTVITNLAVLYELEKMQIDQPISISDIQNCILNSEGVMSLISVKVVSLRGDISGREYSDVYFDIPSNTYQQMIIGPKGSIFELKFPDLDIMATVK